MVAWEYSDAAGELGQPRQRFLLEQDAKISSVPMTTRTRRRAPALFGLGALEAISLDQLRLRSDPLDSDNDGISGRLPWRDDCVGRFGWQSTVCDIPAFVVGALAQEIGIVSFPRSQREISAQEVSDLVAYVRALPPPVQSGSNEGANLFDKAECDKCHSPTTGTAIVDGAVQEVEAYTDLLLHQMGSRSHIGEADSRTEFRTPPLWGVAATGPPYLHDGSAATLEEAILKHRGEAERSRLLFASLRPSEKQQLLNFVRTR